MIERRSEGSQTAERAFAVLLTFKTGPSSLGVSEIARRVGLNTSIVHRLLRSLVSAELLEQDERTSRYRLGRGLASLAEVFFRQRRFDLVEPELRRLSMQCGGSASLAVRDGSEAVILAYTPSLPPDQVDARPRRVPLHLSALGRVLLAFGDADDAGGIEALAPLSAATQWSTTDIDVLRAEVQQVRQQRYSVVSRETSQDQLSVAVPIFDADGRIYLALGMRLTHNSTDEQRVDDVLAALNAASPNVTEILVGAQRVDAGTLDHTEITPRSHRDPASQSS
ncbi:MAG: transcriptional regulator [Ilumatobacteraceae bacterium]|nr:transcriptional regulator [Ilumatobacteraceae bacterium]